MKTSFTKLIIRSCVLLGLVNLCEAQTIYAFAGSGTGGYGGDGAMAIAAQFQTPSSVAVDASGNVYVADTYNARVRKINTAGIITTFAGTGTFGFSGDGGAANLAELNMPTWVAVDPTGNVYVSDAFNLRIRKINTAGVISTIAGTGTAGFSGDGGLAVNAQINCPAGIAVDATGNLYFADACNERVRKINPAGIISTVAGTGAFGFSGDGGPAMNAQLYTPIGIVIDASGNLYISESMNRRIRKVTTAGIISTIAGTGAFGSGGDNGTATSANLSPAGMVIDAPGNLYITDATNNNIRKINPAGIITTFAGTGVAGLGGDGGIAVNAQFKNPNDIAIDQNGNLYIADMGNNRVRKICTNCMATGIIHLSENTNTVLISPNPNNGAFKVQFENTSNGVELILINPLGQKVHSQKIIETTTSVQVNGLPSGLYTCILMQQNKALGCSKLLIE